MNSRGHAYYRLQRYQEAIEDYNRALKFDPTSAAAYTNRGDVNAELGRWGEAAADYRAAIKHNPQLGRAYQSTAWLMATCPEARYRNNELSVEAAQKAISLDGDTDYRYVETLAAALASGEDFEKAVSTQKRVLELAPPEERVRAKQILELYQHEKPYRENALAAKASTNIPRTTAAPPKNPPQQTGRASGPATGRTGQRVGNLQQPPQR